MPTTKFTIKGLKTLQLALDPKRITPIVRKHFKRANELSAIIAVDLVRKTINAGGFKGNAPLTVAIKGENKPLVGKSVGGAGGQLFQAITWKSVKWKTVFIGILKMNRFYNIGYFVHEGGQIGVSDRMRAMFYYLWLASIGAIESSDLEGRAKDLWKMKPGGWKRLAPSTSAITIPSRPFITKTFSSRKFRKLVQINWERAMAAAIKETSKK